MASALVIMNGTGWEVKDGHWIQSSHRLQAKAVEEARCYLLRHRGGELVILGPDGTIQARECVSPVVELHRMRG
jgi:hypothetical protein